MAKCRSKAKHLGEVFRLDAKAEGKNVAIGGWRCCEGRPTREAEWFAVTLNRRNAAWAFVRVEKPSRRLHPWNSCNQTSLCRSAGRFI